MLVDLRAPFAERGRDLSPHTASGVVLSESQWPAARLLRGETIPAHQADEVCFSADEGEIALACSGAPVRDDAGRVLGALMLVKEVPAALPPPQPQPQASTGHLPQNLTDLAGMVFEIITDAIIVLDAEGNLQHQNDAARALFSDATTTGYLDRPFSERRQNISLFAHDGCPLPVDEWPSARVLRGETLAGADTQDISYRNLGGRQLWLNASGVPLRDGERIVGAVVVYRDVTERRLARRTDAVLNALFDLAELAVWTPEDNTTLRVAPASATAEDQSIQDEGEPAELVAAQQIAHLTRDVLACTRVGIVAVDPETRQQRPVAVEGLTPEQKGVWWAEQETEPPLGGDVELTARLLAGETLIIDMTQPPYNTQPNLYDVHTAAVAPMIVGDRLVGMLTLDHSGAAHVYTEHERQLIGAVAHLGALVIERERLFRERAQAQVDLLAAEEANRRMNAFLGMASHELRTPVTSILPTTELVLQWAQRAAQRNEAPDERTLTSLKRVRAQAKRLSRLVDDLLDFARIGADRLELALDDVDLGALAREMAEEARDTNVNRTVTIAAPTEPVMVCGDAMRLGQALANFLTNALKYSPEDQPVHVRVERDESTARVSVRDFGQGIAPDELARIWDLFHRAPGDSSPRGGVNLGVGLHIARTIIERHGGTYGCESTVGQGSTFWFRVPLATDDDHDHADVESGGQETDSGE